MSSIFEISLSGLNVEKQRMELTSLNLANANSVADSQGSVFKPLRLVSQANYTPFADMLTDSLSLGTHTQEIVETEVTPRKVHDPGHPLANRDGFVEYANVNSLKEMMTMLEATRAYEANIKAIGATKSMAMAALEIGRR